MLKYGKVKKKKPAFRLSPDFISNSITTVDFGYLKKLGVTTCFIDLDGTTVSHEAFDVDPAISEVLKTSGLAVHVATNRAKSKDLKNLKDDLHAISVIHPKGIYFKPSKRYYINALKELGLKEQHVIMIGNRYIQDILGANRTGMYSLLVHKLGGNKDRIDKIFSSVERKITEKISKDYQPI